MPQRLSAPSRGGVQPRKSLDLSDAVPPLLRPRFVPLIGLEIAHFRNLGVQNLELPPEGLAVVGENAQGKSNLIEAVYYLETFRSFRGSRDERLIGFGQEVFRVQGSIEGDGVPVRVAAAYQKSDRRKKITLDGTEVERVSEGIGQLGCVVFSPSDTGLVSEGPGERRRFLDILLSLSSLLIPFSI